MPRRQAQQQRCPVWNPAVAYHSTLSGGAFDPGGSFLHFLQSGLSHCTQTSSTSLGAFASCGKGRAKPKLLFLPACCPFPFTMLPMYRLQLGLLQPAVDLTKREKSERWQLKEKLSKNGVQ